MDSATVEFPIRQTSSVLSRKGCRIKVRLYVREHSSPQIPQSHAEGTDGQYLRALLRLPWETTRRHQLKQGNSLLRFLLVEAAQIAVRRRPGMAQQVAATWRCAGDGRLVINHFNTNHLDTA